MDYARYDSCYIEQLANTTNTRPLQGNPVGFDTEKRTNQRNRSYLKYKKISKAIKTVQIFGLILYFS